VRYLHTMHFALPATSPLPGHYDVVVCVRCGTGFADSDAPADAYSEHYRSFSKYEDPSVATGGGDDRADRARIDELAAYFAETLPPDTRVADIGCGNGGLLYALKRRGFLDLTGFDPAIACTARIRANGINSFSLTLPVNDRWRASHNDCRYDLIVLSHVLEHVFDAHAVLESLIPLLSVGGKIYIETPDPARYDTNHFPPLYFFDSEHINHFGRGSLAFLANSFQLSILAIGEKVLRLANGADYPAVYALIQSVDRYESVTTFSDSLFQSLSAYVDQSLRGVTILRERILALIGDATPFVLWGAGSLAQRLIGESWFPLHRLQAVVDRDSKKHGLHFAGKTILSPEVGLRHLPEQTLILCTAAIAFEQIARDYRSLDLPYLFCAIVQDAP